MICCNFFLQQIIICYIFVLFAIFQPKTLQIQQKILPFLGLPTVEFFTFSFLVNGSPILPHNLLKAAEEDNVSTRNIMQMVVLKYCSAASKNKFNNVIISFGTRKTKLPILGSSITAFNSVR